MEDLPPDGSEIVFDADPEHPALGQRRTQLRIASTLVSAGLVLFMVLALLPSLRGQAIAVISGLLPTPTATIAAGSNSIYVLANVPWGTVAIDGNLIAYLSDPNSDTVFSLTRGLHTITWHAAPFAAQQCTISLPYLYTDTCKIAVFTSRHLAVAIVFEASLATADPQNVALTQALADAAAHISSNTMVNAGENVEGLPIATRPLLATLHFTINQGTCQPLNLSAARCMLIGQQDCRQLCAPLMVPTADSHGITWNVYGVAQPRWDYATTSGQILASDRPDGYGGAVDLAGFLPYAIQWDGTHWHATVQTLATPDTLGVPDIGCATAENMLAIASIVPARLDQVTYVPAQNRADGCLVTALAPTATGARAITLLYRLGTFIAVDANTQALAPDLPLPDAYEQHIVRQFGVTTP